MFAKLAKLHLRLLIFIIVLGVLGLVPFASPIDTATPAHASTPLPAPQLHVSGNQLLNAKSHLVQLHGVDKYGTEYMCTRPDQWQHNSNAPFDGPANRSDAGQMLTWKINAVRIPLNEACWLGGAGMDSLWQNYGGWNPQTMYIQPITNYVNLLINAGITPILDLHYAAPGNFVQNGQLPILPLPDRQNSPLFWQQVASTFGANDAVVFDLYNEPRIDKIQSPPPNPWACWGYGTNSTCPQGTFQGMNYDYAGMQELVNTIRAVQLPGGGHPANVLMLGGLDYARHFDQWEQYLPSNTSNLAADWHAYPWPDDCGDNISPTCFYNHISPFIADYPVITGEIGDFHSGDTYTLPLMQFLDNPQQYGYSFPASSYLAWHWNTNADGLQLITSYNIPYPPSQCYGQDYHDYLTTGMTSCIPPS